MNKSISKFGATSSSTNVIKFKITNNTNFDVYITTFNSNTYTSELLLKQNRKLYTLNKPVNNPCVLIISKSIFDSSIYTDQKKWPYVYQNKEYTDSKGFYYCWTFDTLNTLMQDKLLSNFLLDNKNYTFSSVSPFTNISRFGKSKFNKNILIGVFILIICYLIYKKYSKQ